MCKQKSRYAEILTKEPQGQQDLEKTKGDTASWRNGAPNSSRTKGWEGKAPAPVSPMHGVLLRSVSGRRRLRIEAGP